MKRLSLTKMGIVAFLLIGFVAVGVFTVNTVTASHARADASVQNVKTIPASDGRSAQFSFTGTANTDYVIGFYNPDSAHPSVNAHTDDHGDGTGNATVEVSNLDPGALYKFSIEPAGGQTTTIYSFLSENPAKVNILNVNVSTVDNGSSAHISFQGTAAFDYTVVVILDQSPNRYSAHTDDTGNAAVDVKGLKPGATYAFSIQRDVNGQTLKSSLYHLTTYQASGSVKNVVVSYTIDTTVTSFVDRIAKVSFTGTANTKYSLATIFSSGPFINNAATGDNGDGTGNATSFLNGLGSETLNNGSPTYSFQIQLNGQPDSDVYAFTF